MLQWIIDNIASFLVGATVLCLIVLAVSYMVKNKGTCSSCSSCAMRGTCARKKSDKGRE